MFFAMAHTLSSHQFSEKVQRRCVIQGDCLQYLGSPQIWDGLSLRSVLAFMCSLAHGPMPKGTHVRRRCNTRRCVRPDHLYWY